MAEISEKVNIPLFNNPMETFPGLTIDDLNRYLPAIQTVEDIEMELDSMSEGMFFTECLDGLKKLPRDSIDLIITNPLNENNYTLPDFGIGKTLQDYFQWNSFWLQELHRILKNTGALYLFTPWQYSGMYQGILGNIFNIQSRITWRNQSVKMAKDTWKNETADIWFVTKSDEFLFKQHPIGINTIDGLEDGELESNLWLDIPRIPEEGGKFPQKLFLKIIESSSFKLNWVLDPFMGVGDVGVACKNKGRRFIGFESDKDNLLLSMKRVENS